MSSNVKKTLKLWKLLLFLKFPFVFLYPVMREKIIEKSTDLFLTLGFKSVTMDDIANALAVSKKTIYKYFSNKTALVDATTSHVFDTISCGIDGICAMKKDPLEELFSIKKLVMLHLKDEKASPQYQLQKYYPEIYENLKSRQYHTMRDCVIENLNTGIESGVYRENIDVDFVSRIYFHGITGIKDSEMFPLKENQSMKTLMDHFLEYHLRGICTIKGIKQLENQLKSQQ